jgi:exopolysaccharide biosynthesis polyprenyl glycosylphosphotransferase
MKHRLRKKNIALFFGFLNLPVDLLMVLCAFVVAYIARSSIASPIPVIYVWPFEKYLNLAFLMLPVWILAFSLAGLYSQKRQRAFQIGQIIVGSSLGAMAMVLYVFLQRSDFFSRLVVLYIWGLAIVFVAIGRAILGIVKSRFYLRRENRILLAIIGKPDATSGNIASQVISRPSLGYKLVGFISVGKSTELDDINYLGSIDDLEKIINDKKIDEVVMTDTALSNDMLFEILRTCQENHIIFKAVPAHAQVGARALQYDEFSGVPIIEFQGTALQGWGVFAKRAIDILGSLIAIVLTSPIVVILYILIKLDSKGPAIYKNVRVSNKGDFFTYKFRTMHIEYCTGKLYGGHRAEEFQNKLIKSDKNIKQGDALYKIADDPRVTRIGKFLRKTSLDELPQFYNVLIGNMSLVGPRPHQPNEVQNYTSEQRKLLLIKPGITGLAQISGRSDLSFEEEARLDIFYLENWSVAFDLYIIAKTFVAVVKGKGGY